MGNFAFLQTYWPDFANTLDFAEKYAYSDPASSKNKSGLFVELMVREIMRIEHIAEPADTKENTHYNRIKILKSEGLLPYDVNQWIHQVRKSRNDSAHEDLATEAEALSVLRFTHHIAVWFMQTYGDGSFTAEAFVPPEPPKRKISLLPLVKNQERKIEEQKTELENAAAAITEKEALIAERDRRVKELEEEIEKARKEREAAQKLTPQSERTKQERQTASAAAIERTRLTEAETRALIDEQLRRVGWEADTENLRYAKGTRPQKGRKIAIAEWPVDSGKDASAAFKNARADYALFAGEELIGIIKQRRTQRACMP